MYGVVYVRDDELPANQEWAVVEASDGDVFVIFKASTVRAQSLAEAWAAVRRLGTPPPTLPTPRQLWAVS